MTVVCLKLVTGEEVVGTLISEDMDKIVLRCPMKASSSFEDNRPAIRFVRYDLLGDVEGETTFFTRYVVSCGPPLKKVVDYYHEISNNMNEGTQQVEQALAGTHPGFDEKNDLPSVEELLELIAGRATIQ